MSALDRRALVDEMVRAHRAHTVVLYGSHARGDATEESDVDVACFADVPEGYRDARSWEGRFLDGFVYATAVAEQAATDEMTKLCGAEVLLDERGLARPMLDRLAAFANRPVEPLPETERRMRRVWAQKMLARIRRGDVEASYRWHWLLFQLLEDHYPMIGRRYFGPKRSFADLEAREPETFAAFRRALAPGASFADVEALVAHLDRAWSAGDSSATK